VSADLPKGAGGITLEGMGILSGPRERRDDSHILMSVLLIILGGVMLSIAISGEAYRHMDPAAAAVDRAVASLLGVYWVASGLMMHVPGRWSWWWTLVNGVLWMLFFLYLLGLSLYEYLMLSAAGSAVTATGAPIRGSGMYLADTIAMMIVMVPLLLCTLAFLQCWWKRRQKHGITWKVEL